jgi:hypothetical protein
MSGTRVTGGVGATAHRTAAPRRGRRRRSWRRRPRCGPAARGGHAGARAVDAGALAVDAGALAVDAGALAVEAKALAWDAGPP